MSTRKAKIVVMVALSGAALAVACGGGSGEPAILGSPYEQRPGAFDKPTTSNQDPSPAQNGAGGGQTTVTNPPQGTSGQTSGGTSGQTSGGTSGQTSGGTSGQTSGGTSGQTSGGTSGNTSGGTSGTMAGCPQCDGTFTCDVTLSGSTMSMKSTVMLVTKNGACTFSSQGQADVVLACGGALTSSGQNVGTWANCTRAPTP